MYVSINVGGKFRNVRALETPPGTGFRDLLGHWVFEDDQGVRIDSCALSDNDRRVIIDASRKDDR